MKLLLLLALMTGCSTLRPVKPDALPRLNGATDMVTRLPNDTRLPYDAWLVQRTVHQAESPDGTLFEVRGAFHAYVTTTEGEQTKFEHPIHADIQDDRLIVRSRNHVPTSFALEDVAQVAVSQPSLGRTLALACGVGGGVILALVGGAVGIFLATDSD